MRAARDVAFLSAVRTAVGDYAPEGHPADDLAAKVVNEAVQRAKVKPAEVGYCVFGNVIHTEPKAMYRRA